MYTIIKITMASYLIIYEVFVIKKVHQLHYRLDRLYTFSFTKENLKHITKTSDIAIHKIYLK